MSTPGTPVPGPASGPVSGPASGPAPAPVVVTAAAVFVGGLLGGLAREGLVTVWPGGTIPWAVLVINVLGSFVLGVVAEIATGRLLHRHPVLAVRLTRPTLGTGFCGGFTTFSSLAVALDTLTRDGRAGAAAFYLGASLVLGLVAVAAGAALGRRVAR